MVEAEAVAAEPDALSLIAQAAEGSARDGLSILDQAISHAELGDGAPLVTAAQVRDMLGLSDRGSTRRLLGLLLAGDTAALLTAVRDQYALGVEPLSLMRGLMELVHAVTLQKAGRDIASPGQSAEEREALADWASQLGFAPLHRLWQLLLKGHDEVANAVLPIESCEMALLRVMHAATLPDPSEIARMLRDGGPAASHAQPSGPAPAATEPTPTASLPKTLTDVVNLVHNANQARLAGHLHDCGAVGSFDPPAISLRLTSAYAGGDFYRELATVLREKTGVAWQVRVAEGDVQPTLQEQEDALKDAERANVKETPVVKAALNAFPHAELVDSDRSEPWSASA